MDWEYDKAKGPYSYFGPSAVFAVSERKMKSTSADSCFHISNLALCILPPPQINIDNVLSGKYNLELY